MSQNPERNIKVLIVDDEATYRMVLEEFLTLEGFTCKGAENAAEALAALEQGAFDVVVTDLRMPGLPGTELLRIVKARWPEVEVVIMSAYARLDDAIAAVHNGAYDILLKPFENLDVIKNMIERIEKKIGDARTSKQVVASLKSNNKKLTSLQDAVQWLHHENTEFLTRSQYQRVELADLYSKVLSAARLFTDAHLALFFRTDAEENMLRLARADGADVPAEGLLLDVPEMPSDLTSFAAFRYPVERWAGRPLSYGAVVEVAGERHGAIAFLGRRPEEVDEFERGLCGQFVIQVSLMLAGNLQYQKVLELTNRDGLTGLYNHRYLQARLQSEVARCKRYGHPMAVLFSDIDHFKSFNDRNGHPAGDALLIEVSRVLAESSRDSDVLFRPREGAGIAARYGGEEFLLILPETDKAGARIRADRIRALIASTSFKHGEGQPLGHVSVSIGVSAYPVDGIEAADLIKAADTALYKAKTLGRNRVCAAGIE